MRTSSDCYCRIQKLNFPIALKGRHFWVEKKLVLILRNLFIWTFFEFLHISLISSDAKESLNMFNKSQNVIFTFLIFYNTTQQNTN